jgi:hypothetical protein
VLKWPGTGHEGIEDIAHGVNVNLFRLRLVGIFFRRTKLKQGSATMSNQRNGEKSPPTEASYLPFQDCFPRDMYTPCLPSCSNE